MPAKQKLIYLLSIILHLSIGVVQSCTTSDGNPGRCQALPQCSYAMKLIQEGGITFAKEFLDYNGCGFDGTNPKVCCPQDQGGTSGRGPWDQEDYQNNSVSSPGGQAHPNPSLLLPDNCGLSEDNRIIGGEKTELGEFPWMAVLEYIESRRDQRTGCGGALISKRYVLTAAHCIRNIPSTWRLTSVRLGEHDMNTDPDCIDEGNGHKTCADPVIRVPVEEVIVHENYNKTVRLRNDIALLRLSYDVPTTRYVRPICLPISSTVSNLYTSAGWGQTETTRSSHEKLKVSLPYMDFNQCATKYRNQRVILGEGQMCAGGRAGKDTCKGDSGGPLMKRVSSTSGTGRWFIDGIVSFGYSPCGLPGWPGVYTKVFNYGRWILSKLRL